jgi:nitroreductase
MNELLHFLQNRNSGPRLCKPAPNDSELAEMVRAAVRAPDHAWLRPWRFLSVSGERRYAFGDLVADSLLKRNPETDDTARLKAQNSALRAPLVVVVIAAIQAHPKVPAMEQRLSAGCAAHSILLAAETMGYAGVWRTGDVAFDRQFMTALGLAPHEEIIAFLYLGTRDGPAKTVPPLNPDHFLSDW